MLFFHTSYCKFVSLLYPYGARPLNYQFKDVYFCPLVMLSSPKPLDETCSSDISN